MNKNTPTQEKWIEELKEYDKSSEGCGRGSECGEWHGYCPDNVESYISENFIHKKEIVERIREKRKVILSSKEVDEIYEQNEGNITRREILDAHINQVTAFNHACDEIITSLADESSESRREEIEG